MAAHVVVGNEVLREYAGRYNSNVSIIPTTIDVEKYKPACRYDMTESPPVLGWSGSYSTIQYLEPLKPAFEKLAKKHPFSLEIICRRHHVPVRQGAGALQEVGSRQRG